ncbi:MAG: GGDEF domain-containing protein [Gammaproteobacteria bacterium]|nr:GGDEF domain-containing protein [Gammaproteobacteria bacterium]
MEWKRHQRMEYEIAVILCDIDYFKKYNDTYGHLEGDQCLQRVAQVIDAAARRPGDLAARYGGEEFVIILSETDREGVQSVINNIQENVKRLEISHPGSLVNPHITLSLGAIHTIPKKDQEFRDAIHTADLALYAAKSQGRNRSIIT